MEFINLTEIRYFHLDETQFYKQNSRHFQIRHTGTNGQKIGKIQNPRQAAHLAQSGLVFFLHQFMSKKLWI